MVFLKNDNNHLCIHFKKIERTNKRLLVFITNEEDSNIERTLIKQMEANFAKMFEYVRHERS